MNPALLAQLLQQAQGGVLRRPPQQAFGQSDEQHLRSQDPDFLRYSLEPLNSEQEQLQRQIDMANALMQGSGQRYSSPLGTAIGGLSDAIRMGMGAYRMGNLERKQQGFNLRRQEMIDDAGRGPSTIRLQKPTGLDPVTEELRRQSIEIDRAREERLRKEGEGLAGYRDETLALKKKRLNAPWKQPTPPRSPTLPAGEVATLGDVDTAISGLQDLLSAHGSMAGGPMDSIAARLPGTEAAKYSDKVLAAAQAVGKILEGGKLAAGDEVKYRKMLPDASDSPDRARQKVENVTKLLQQSRANKIKAFGQAGYNVQGMTPTIDLTAPAPPAPAGQKSILSKQTLEDGTEIILYSDGTGEKRVPKKAK